MSCSSSSGGAGATARPTCHVVLVHSTCLEPYRKRADRHWLHQKLVAFARANGLKAAARKFGCSRETVREWLRCYIPGKPSAVQEHGRRSKHCPGQISPGLEGQIVKLRRQTGLVPNASNTSSLCPAAPTSSPACSASTN
jgi:transposase-like protein